jgi:hypothetical protein
VSQRQQAAHAHRNRVAESSIAHIVGGSKIVGQLQSHNDIQMSRYFYDEISSALGLGTRDSAGVESRKGMWNS